MTIKDLLENYRKQIFVDDKPMGKNVFYNFIFGTGMKPLSTNNSILYSFKNTIKQDNISRFFSSYIVYPDIRDRFQEIEKNDLYERLSEHYRKNLTLPDKVKEYYFQVLKRILESIGVDFGVDTDDFYRYLAHTVYFCIFNDILEAPDTPFIPNNEPIYKQMMRIFNDDNINYIVIATQVGMILVTNDSVRAAVTEYLKKGKTLEVIINSAEIRNAVGAHMRNPDISHQTETERVCELWKEIKQKVGNAKLLVATTDLPILHQIIKTSKIVDDVEQNVSVEVRMYSYLVENKEDNIAFSLTTMSNKYKTINEELNYLRRNAISKFIITVEGGPESK